MDKYTLKRQGEEVLQKLNYNSPATVKADIERWVSSVRESHFVYQSRGVQALNNVQRDLYDKNKITDDIQTILSSI